MAKVVDELPLIEEPDSFLDNKEISEKLKCAIQQLESGMNKKMYSSLQHIVRTWLFTTCSWVIENVSIEEFTQGELKTKNQWWWWPVCNIKPVHKDQHIWCLTKPQTNFYVSITAWCVNEYNQKKEQTICCSLLQMAVGILRCTGSYKKPLQLITPRTLNFLDHHSIGR